MFTVSDKVESTITLSVPKTKIVAFAKRIDLYELAHDENLI